MSARFRDRQEAGERLGAILKERPTSTSVIFGLARGGAIVAKPVALALHAPLEVLVARKVGAPGQPEFGIGAVGPGGAVYSEAAKLGELGITRAEFDLLAQQEAVEVRRRLLVYRGQRSEQSCVGKVAILVDDGIATGVTAMAALRYLQSLRASKLVVAVPVGSIQGLERIQSECDEVVCLCRPTAFHAVGQWYDAFDQVTDSEVLAALSGS